MKKYVVEMKEEFSQDYDNPVGDYTEAETAEEAMGLVKLWLLDNGYDKDVDNLIFKVTEYIK